MARRLLVALLSAICCLGLVGCDSDPTPDSPSSGSSATPTTPPPTTVTTSTPPDEGPPVLPDAARERTNAGAKAFLSFYFDTLNYAHTQGSTVALRRLAGHPCEICDDFADGIDRTYSRGGYQRGGNWSTKRLGIIATTYGADRSLRAEIHQTAGIVRSSKNARPQRIKMKSLFYGFDLVWQRDGWRLSEVSA